MYGLTFFNRDFTLRPQPPISLAVDSLQWSSEGGPSLALVSATLANLSTEALVELLRCPVLVWNEQGRVIWWGYLESVELRVPEGAEAEGIKFDLSTMANHVQAMYTFTDDQATLTVTGTASIQGTNTGDLTLSPEADEFLELTGQQLTMRALVPNDIPVGTSDLRYAFMLAR